MANFPQFNPVLRRLRQNPKKVLQAAKRGSAEEMTVLSNTWADQLSFVSPSDVIDVWLHHLDPSRVPTDIQKDGFSEAANSAFASYLGMSKMGPFFLSHPGLVEKTADGWPGMFKWSVFLLASRVERLKPDDMRRKSTLDVISMSWYAMAYIDVLRKLMLETPAALEIATRLWLEEDKGPLPSNLTSPTGTSTLGNLLKFSKASELDRVLKAAGGKAGEIAKLSLTRLKKALKAPQPNSSHLIMYLKLVNSISRALSHPIRRALLSANAIWIITSALVKLSVFVNTSRDTGFLDVMITGFGFLSNCLESEDGFTWISQSLDAGLLCAYCDCSPQFSKVEGENLEMIMYVVDNILPRYLVYRTVIEAVDASMRKLTKAQSDRVGASVAREGWAKFSHMAHERHLITVHTEAIKGTHMICDNINCQKECQTIAWKEGDHKTMCKLKERERIEGKYEIIRRKDDAFFHVIFMRDARKNRQQFRKMFRDTFPSTTLRDCVVRLDYTVIPTKYSVKLLKTFDPGPTQGTDNAVARNEALIEKVQTHPDRFTLIESRISCGQTQQCVLTLALRDFWQKSSTQGEFPDDDVGEYGSFDHIDLMKANLVMEAFKQKFEIRR